MSRIRKTSRLPGIVFGLACLCFLFSARASDIFLKIPGIDGESLDRTHAKEIEVLGWTWSLSQTTSGAGPGRLQLGDLNIVKWVDKASPLLMLRCSKGTVLSNALLTCRSGGASPVEFIKIALSNLTVTGVFESGSSGADRHTENAIFNYSAVEFDYFYVLPTGGTQKFPFNWDLARSDSDGDGMPDSFEEAYGLDKTRNDAAEDKDGDGMTNLDEYLAGTNPAERDSVFKCKLVYVVGDPTATLSWNSVASREYLVNYADNLGTGFTPFGNYIGATGSVTQISVPLDLARRFYRVQIKPLN